MNQDPLATYMLLLEDYLPVKKRKYKHSECYRHLCGSLLFLLRQKNPVKENFDTVISAIEDFNAHCLLMEENERQKTIDRTNG